MLVSILVRKISGLVTCLYQIHMLCLNRDLKKKLTISYPCVMLNVDVARNNTNDQYQVSWKYFSIFLFPLPCELQYQNSLYCDLVCMFMILQLSFQVLTTIFIRLLQIQLRKLMRLIVNVQLNSKWMDHTR